jgi:PAS domain S-box-containing protein
MEMKNTLALPEIETKLNDRVFRALMENANDAIFVLSLEGFILYGNQKSEKMLGVSREQMKGKFYNDFTVPEDVEHTAYQVGEVVDGNLGRTETRILQPDGHIVDVVFSAVMIELEDQKVMLGIGRDVTEQKKTEEDRMRLAAIVEYSNDAIYAMDLDGIINVWNPGAERLFGYGSHEVLGRHIFMLIPSDRHPEMLRMMETCKKGQTLTRVETTRKNRLQEKIPISVNWFPIRDKKGTIQGISAIVRDLTEPKHQEEFFRIRGEE